MNEATLRGEVGRLVRACGWWNISQTDASAGWSTRARRLMDEVTQMTMGGRKQLRLSVLELKNELDRILKRPPKGRPDVFGLHPGYGDIVFEVKMFPAPKTDEWDSVDAFSFSEVDEKQRRWLDLWTEDADRYRKIGGWLVLGTRHGIAGAKTNPRRAWMVAWKVWRYLEVILEEAGQKSLPLTVKKGMRKTVQERNLCALHLLGSWELQWEKGIGWRFPPTHPLYPVDGYLDLAALSKRWDEWTEEKYRPVP